MKIVSQERVNLKGNPDINEKAIQDYIFDNPSVMGLGDLQPIVKEKTQPLGGRLDMLFSDEDNNRYEVELQLGATDPSHIVRTLEYWDTERKRYPQYDHTAVIIAEDITSRFQNVISLFNNHIPLIAIQLSATKTEDGNLAIAFIKVMDRIELGTDEEEYAETTDRAYWEKRSAPKMLKLMDELYEGLGERKDGYELKYNKFYVGLAKDGVAKNFVVFRPKKTFVKMSIYAQENTEAIEMLEQAGVDINYSKRISCYELRLSDKSELAKCKDVVMQLIDEARATRGVD